MIKSELALEFDKWLETPQGIQAKSTDICMDQYGEILMKRLEAAFLAGAIANENIDEIFRQELSQSFGL